MTGTQKQTMHIVTKVAACRAKKLTALVINFEVLHRGGTRVSKNIILCLELTHTLAVTEVLHKVEVRRLSARSGWLWTTDSRVGASVVGVGDRDGAANRTSKNFRGVLTDDHALLVYKAEQKRALEIKEAGAMTRQRLALITKDAVE